MSLSRNKHAAGRDAAVKPSARFSATPGDAVGENNEQNSSRRGVQPRAALWVYGDDLSPAAAHQQDPVETLHHDLQKLHVWDASVKGEHVNASVFRHHAQSRDYSESHDMKMTKIQARVIKNN